MDQYRRNVPAVPPDDKKCKVLEYTDGDGVGRTR